MTFYIITVNEDEPELIGPFEDGSEAVEFATENMQLEPWWVTSTEQATSPSSSAFEEVV